MTSDQAFDLFTQFTTATLYLAGPVLAVAVLAGTLVGVAQTATQVNEPSISYGVKVAALVGFLLLAGPVLAEKLTTYTRATFASIAHVRQ